MKNYKLEMMEPITKLYADHFKGLNAKNMKALGLGELSKMIEKAWAKAVRMYTVESAEAQNRYYKEAVSKLTEALSLIVQNPTEAAARAIMGGIIKVSTVTNKETKAKSVKRSYVSVNVFKKVFLSVVVADYECQAFCALNEKDENVGTDKPKKVKKGKSKAIKLTSEEILKYQNGTVEEKAALMDAWFASLVA